ncbi:MAG TPA: SEC-C metal-binding domain-containing protein, partial [Candidatus Hypogeohydataceae bacterium YC38]
MKVVGRNNPCPCGSGKKYKECCLNKSAFVVKPSNQPEVIDNHLVSSNGKTWGKRPGLLAVQLHYVKPEDVDSQIDGIFKEIFDCLKETKYQN